MDNNHGAVVTDGTSINISGGASNNFASATLISINEVPIKFRHIFSNYIYFNRIQTGVFRDIIEKDDSLVVSAPTGSGKTVAFELAIVKLLHSLDMAGEDYNNYKIIYIAPMKALCEERLADWHKKFSSVGVNCASVTGDSDIASFQSLVNLNLIITTPEKWDSLTRRWRSNKRFVSKVVLFMIDEVHLLNDESRGPTLEAIVSRMKTIEDNKDHTNNLTKIRFLAVSATIPNVQDIAAWLQTHEKPAKHYSFGDETRPVKLNKIVIGYHYSPLSSTEFKFDMMLSYKLQGIIMQHSQGKATLIFCSTRKSVEMTAKHLTQNLTIRLNADQKKILEDAGRSITTAFIRTALVNGVACHHAGMLVDHRRTIEELFRNGDLPVIVTTSTLAMGVNLPAHLVIIKGTKYYAKGEYLDYDNSILLQMIGRAGRPQFDSSATAVILTKMADKNKFENMVDGIQPIESSLHKHLTAHLNAEVVLRTITDLGVAMNWLTSTFLYVRARKHPKHYGLPVGSTTEQLDRKLLDMCQIEINKLAKVGMISMDQNVNLMPTAIGSLMAKYCIHFETMKLFKEVKGTEILQQILVLISRCHEFSDLYLRVNDKKTLNLLNKCKNRETIRYPLSGKIKTVDMKINCIIQAVFGCLQIVETSLLNEAQKIMRIGERVSKALAEYLESKENCFQALLNAIILAKCFHARIWENSPYISKQLEGIGIVLSGHLVAAGKTSFRALLEANPRNLEMIIHRKSPIGDDIQGQVKHLPIYKLTLEEIKISSTISKVKVIINLLNPEQLQERTTLDPNSEMNLLIGDDHNNILKYEKYTHSYMVENSNVEHELETEFNCESTIKAYFVSENWAGIDCNASIELFPSEKKRAAKPKAKQAVAKPNFCGISEGKLEALSNITNKKYIFDYFNMVKKSKAAQTKTLEAKALTEEEENQLIGNVTLDEENMNQADEIQLLDSSVDSDIGAALDLAESEYNSEKREMSDTLKKLLSKTTEEYQKVQKVLDATYDPSAHFQKNDANDEVTVKKLLSNTIEEYLEEENANATPRKMSNEATPNISLTHIKDADNGSQKKLKYKFKQLRPSAPLNERKMAANSTQGAESDGRSRNESVKEFDTSNGFALRNPNDQNGHSGEFMNSTDNWTLQRDAALNEYFQNEAQPDVSPRLEDLNSGSLQGAHQVRFQVGRQNQDSGRSQSMHRNQVELKNYFQVEPETQIPTNFGNSNAGRLQVEPKYHFQVEPETHELSNVANSNTGRVHQFEGKYNFQNESQIQGSSDLINANDGRFQDEYRNQVEPKTSFQIKPQTHVSSNIATSNTSHKNQIEVKNHFQNEPQVQVSSDFVNSNAGRFEHGYRNQVEPKTSFQTKPQTQMSSNVETSNTSHKNRIEVKNHFQNEPLVQDFVNSNAGRFEHGHRNQVEPNTSFQIKPQTQLSSNVETSHKNRIEVKNHFQNEPEVKVSSDFVNSNAGRFEHEYRNKVEPKTRFQVELQTHVANINSERLQASHRNQIEVKNHFQNEPQVQVSSDVADTNTTFNRNQIEAKNPFQIPGFSNLANSNAERAPATYRDQFKAKNRFEIEAAQTQTSSYAEKYQVEPKNRFQGESQNQISLHLANSKARRFQAMHRNQTQVFSNFRGGTQSTQRNQIEPKPRFQFEPDTLANSNLPGYRNQVEAQTQAFSNSEKLQAWHANQVEVKKTKVPSNSIHSNIFNMQNNGEFSNAREETSHNATNKDFCNPKANFSIDFGNASFSSQISNLEEPEDAPNYNWSAPNTQIQYKSCNSPRFSKNVSPPSRMMSGSDSASTSSYRTAEETNVPSANKYEPGTKHLSMRSFPSIDSIEVDAGSPCLPCYSPATKAEHQSQIREGLRKTFSLEPKKPFQSVVAKHPIEPDSTNDGEYKCVEILSPKRPKLIEASDSSRKSIKWSSPLVTSPGVKYSPKLKNTRCNAPTPATRKREEFKAPKRSQLSNFSLKTPKNLVDFPITDKQCAYVSNSQNRLNSVKDMFSQSFIDMLSCDVNPDKKPKQFSMQGLDSYTRSQILERPSTITSSTQKRDNAKGDKSETSQNKFITPMKYQNYLEQKEYPMQSDFDENYSAAPQRNYAVESQRNYVADETEFLKNRLDIPNFAARLSDSSAHMRPSQENYASSTFDPADETQFLKNRLLAPRQLGGRTQENHTMSQDFSQNFYNEVSAQPEISRRPAFLDKSTEFYNQQDLLQRNTDFSGRLQNLPQRQTDFSEGYTNFPGRHEEFRERHTDFPERYPNFAQRYADFRESRPEFQGRYLSEGEPDFLQMHPDFAHRGSDFERLDFSFNFGRAENQFAGLPRNQNVMSPLAMDTRGAPWDDGQGVYRDNFFMDRNPNFHESYNPGNYHRFNI